MIEKVYIRSIDASQNLTVLCHQSPPGRLANRKYLFLSLNRENAKLEP